MTFRGTLRSASTRKAAIASGGKPAFDLFADELDEDSERAKHHKDDNHPCRGVVIKVKVRVEVWVCSIHGAYYTAPYFPMSSDVKWRAALLAAVLKFQTPEFRSDLFSGVWNAVRSGLRVRFK